MVKISLDKWQNLNFPFLCSLLWHVCTPFSFIYMSFCWIYTLFQGSMYLPMSLQVSHVFLSQNMLGMVVPKPQRSRGRNEIEPSIKNRIQAKTRKKTRFQQENDHTFSIVQDQKVERPPVPKGTSNLEPQVVE